MSRDPEGVALGFVDRAPCTEARRDQFDQPGELPALQHRRPIPRENGIAIHGLLIEREDPGVQVGAELTAALSTASSSPGRQSCQCGDGGP